eukprot:468935-Amphidinium_carterae.1
MYLKQLSLRVCTTDDHVTCLDGSGFTDDLRKDRNLFLEAIKAAKVSPEERFADDEPCRAKLSSSLYT